MLTDFLKAGTINGYPLLADGQGFRYTLKKDSPTTWSWTCSHRSPSNPCRARVSQKVKFLGGSTEK